MAFAIGESDYRLAGLERLNEAGILLGRESFAGSIYLGGRAVESMLRAVIWRHDPEIRAGKMSLDTGHDLRQLLTLVANLGVLNSNEHRGALATDIQHVGRLWFNNMRFVATERLQSSWRKAGELRGKRTLKQAARDYYDSCSAIVKRCEVLCR